MTDGQEARDIASINATLDRMDKRLGGFGDRLDKLERFADRVEGALTLAKIAITIVGFGGLVWLIQSAASVARAVSW